MKQTYWENLCKRCGQCCHEKYIHGDTVLYELSAACPYLDRVTNQCSIYSRRKKIYPQCRKITLWKAMFASYLPPDCGYVEWAEKMHIRFAGKKAFIWK